MILWILVIPLMSETKGEVLLRSGDLRTANTPSAELRDLHKLWPLVQVNPGGFLELVGCQCKIPSALIL